MDPLTYLGTYDNNNIEFTHISSVRVENIISNLKCKPCKINSIPVKAYKLVSHVISPIIANLFNSSLIEGIFPKSFKTAETIPIHKSGSTNLLNNFRPITLSSVLSKIFEKLMREQLIDYLDNINFFIESQFGFRKNLNTSDAINQFLEHCYKSLSNKNHTIALFLDLKKAFDSVDRSILLKKLFHIGIRGHHHKWLTSYLSDRKQYCTVRNENSDTIIMAHGVPQGTVLAPLLFLVYINDLAKCSRCLQFINFADDTTAFVSGNNIDNLYEVVNVEIDNINRWLITNKLAMNETKTVYMLITHSRAEINNEIKISQHTLKRVNVAKFLGIFIDEKLTFKRHTEYICKKLSKSNGIIYRVSQYLPLHVLRILYFSFILPYLNYCITTWGNCSLSHLNRVTSIQKRALKTILRGNVHDTILTFHNLYKYNCLVNFYKAYRMGIPSFFHDSIVNLEPTHEHVTRRVGQNNINIPLYLKSRCQQSFLFNACKFWNELPAHIKSINELSKFQMKCKETLLNNQNYH